MKRTTFFLLLVLSGTFCSQARAQKVAIKTNVLYDAFLNVNVGVEVGLAPRWTFDLSADYNGWTLSHERKWSIGCYSLRRVIGSATVLPVILWVSTL